jgi:hypothetical protein
MSTEQAATTAAAVIIKPRFQAIPINESAHGRAGQHGGSTGDCHDYADPARLPMLAGKKVHRQERAETVFHISDEEV